LSVSTDKFKAFRKKFTDAGIDINVLHLNFPRSATDDEIDYFFQMAKAIGARSIASLNSVSMSKQIGPFADKHKMLVGYHNHSNVTDPEEFCTPQSWETAMSYAKYNGINLDVGHWMAGNNVSPVPFMKNCRLAMKGHLSRGRYAASGSGSSFSGVGASGAKP